MPEVSVIMSVYNGMPYLPEAVDSILNQTLQDFEFLIINDGSTDRTSTRAEEAGVQVIKHLRNKGYGASLKTGVRNARGDIVFFLDADAQHDPNDIKKIVADMDKHDMVVGARTSEGKSSLAMQFALALADQHAKVGYFSLEMSREQLMERIIDKHNRR